MFSQFSAAHHRGTYTICIIDISLSKKISNILGPCDEHATGCQVLDLNA